METKDAHNQLIVLQCTAQSPEQSYLVPTSTVLRLGHLVDTRKHPGSAQDSELYRETEYSRGSLCTLSQGRGLQAWDTLQLVSANALQESWARTSS